jgi:ribosomal protein S18 acetylase RimI-like enzyme
LSAQHGSSEPVVVRKARPSDHATLVRFNCALARESEGLALDRDVVARGVAAALADPARGEYRVAEVRGAIAGALLLTREWSDWRDGWIVWIQSVYVEPAHRRTGVYRALHRAVERELAEQGGCVALRLYVDRRNTSAQATYARLGMRPSGYVVFEADDALRERAGSDAANSGRGAP